MNRRKLLSLATMSPAAVIAMALPAAAVSVEPDPYFDVTVENRAALGEQYQPKGEVYSVSDDDGHHTVVPGFVGTPEERQEVIRRHTNARLDKLIPLWKSEREEREERQLAEAKQGFFFHVDIG